MILFPIISFIGSGQKGSWGGGRSRTFCFTGPAEEFDRVVSQHETQDARERRTCSFHSTVERRIHQEILPFRSPTTWPETDKIVHVVLLHRLAAAIANSCHVDSSSTEVRETCGTWIQFSTVLRNRRVSMSGYSVSCETESAVTRGPRWAHSLASVCSYCWLSTFGRTISYWNDANLDASL